MTVVIGVDPHKRTHTAVVIDHDEVPRRCKCVPGERSSRSCWRGRRASTSACGRSSPRTGWVTCLASSSSVPVSGCWMCRRRCRAGAGVGDVTFEQERPERRAVGRDRGSSRAACHRGPGHGSSGGVAVVGEAPHRSGPVAEPECVSAPRTAVRARRGRNQQGNHAEQGATAARHAHAEHTGRAHSPPARPGSRRGPAPPRRAAARLAVGVSRRPSPRRGPL